MFSWRSVTGIGNLSFAKMTIMKDTQQDAKNRPRIMVYGRASYRRDFGAPVRVRRAKRPSRIPDRAEEEKRDRHHFYTSRSASAGRFILLEAFLGKHDRQLPCSYGIIQTKTGKSAPVCSLTFAHGARPACRPKWSASGVPSNSTASSD